MQRNKLIWLVVLAVVLVGGIGTGGIYFFKNQKSLPVVESENLTYAKKTLDWLESQKEGNVYPVEETCRNDNCGVRLFVDEGNKEDLLVIWAKYLYLKTVKSDSGIKKLETGLKDYLVRAKKGEKSDLLVCTIANEFVGDKNFSENIKQQLKSLCLDKTYLSLDDVSNYKVIFGSKFTRILASKGDKDPRVSYNSWEEYEVLRGIYSDYLTVPLELVGRYKISGDKNDIDLAKGYLDNIENIFMVDGYEGESRCLVGINALSVYKVDQNQKYLNLAKGVVEKISEDLIDTENRNYNGPFCVWFNREMDQYTERNLMDENNKIIERWKKVYWDGEGGINKKVGDDGFYLVGMGRVSKIIKDISQNALMVSQLTK